MLVSVGKNGIRKITYRLITRVKLGNWEWKRYQEFGEEGYLDSGS